MNTYIQDSEVSSLLAWQDVIDYPNAEDNRFNYFKEFAFAMDDWGKFRPAPAELVLESMHHIGREPVSVLDVGGGNGRQSLLLAELGHKVTLLDINDDVLEQAREHARARGIPTANFRPVRRDMRELTADDKFQVVMSIMALHFLERAEAHQAIRAMKAATAAGGLFIADSYTTDNPRQERQRGIRHMFEPGELGRSVAGTTGDWRLLRTAEGVTSTGVFRGNIAGKSMCLVPTVAQVIARNAGTQAQTYMNANREIVRL